jgi:hypothetical protein
VHNKKFDSEMETDYHPFTNQEPIKQTTMDKAAQIKSIPKRDPTKAYKTNKRPF